ncbi:hypothetical protein EDB84DRAFT_1454687 [Lactarius hengduanensis]|nr:hypothetical protein EDB84DRAFT_1454687 [Lactarius hengduanensis]
MTSQMPSATSPVMAPVDSEASPSTPGPTPGTRLVIFAALLLPSALVPLFVLRRSVNQLHRKIDELKGATNSLHQEFKTVMLELSIRREQHEQLRAMIAETRERLANWRRETQRKQATRANWDQQTREQIQGLVTSNRIQTSRLRELGTSLADVAAFMQEIELQQGFFSPKVDGRGIERLRFLAMQFERMGKTKDSGAEKGGSTASDAQHNSKAGVGKEK